MATTISKINVYKNNEWESYPISTTASNVVTTDGNLTNTISSLKTEIAQIKQKIPTIQTNLGKKLDIYEPESIRNDLEIMGNLKISGKLDVEGGDISSKNHQFAINDLDFPSSTPSTTYFSRGNGRLCFYDAEGNPITYLQSTFDTNGGRGLELCSIRDINSEHYYNNLQLKIKENGDHIVTLSHPEAWRNALNVEHLDTAETSSTNRYTRYMKFEDGSLICMVEVVWTGSITTTYGSVFYNDSAINGGNWPVAFTGVPYISMTCARGGTAFVGPSTSVSKTSIGTLYLYKPLRDTNAQQNYYIDIIGYGRWK